MARSGPWSSKAPTESDRCLSFDMTTICAPGRAVLILAAPHDDRDASKLRTAVAQLLEAPPTLPASCGQECGQRPPWSGRGASKRNEPHTSSGKDPKASLLAEGLSRHPVDKLAVHGVCEGKDIAVVLRKAEPTEGSGSPSNAKSRLRPKPSR